MQEPCRLLKALLTNFPIKDVLVFLLYWFQNSSVLSVRIGGDDEQADVFEDVDTEEDLDLYPYDVSGNLYFPKRVAGGQPDPGENDLVLFLVDLISSGVT